MWGGICQTRKKMWSFVVTSMLAVGLFVGAILMAGPAESDGTLYRGTMAVTDPGKHPLFPPTQFFTAVGASDESFTAAAATAKLEILRQVASAITASEATGHEELSLAEQTLFEDPTSDDATALELAAQGWSQSYTRLVKIDSTMNVRIKGRFYTFAYLPRSAVDAKRTTRS